jgi:4-amino-4-deoxy-L-arabinose transferase-like glycosyltransferase
LKTKTIFIFLVALFIVKLALAVLFPVFGDEAYYYIWSLHPQLSYFDHPPMVSWLIYLSHLIFPAGNPLGLRFSFVFLSFLTSLVWLKILKDKKIENDKQFLFFAFMALNPLLGIGSIVATPDVALAFFWSLSYLFFERLLNSKNIINYTLLGLSLGLGFCSKYHIVVFVISGLIYLTLTKQFKKLKPIGILTTVALGGLTSLPVTIWNAQNEWASFLFQIDHGFGEETFSWSWPLGYLVAQCFIANPFFIYILFKKSIDPTQKIFSLSQLGFFLTSSFKSVVEGNWPLTSQFHTSLNGVLGSSKKQIAYAFTFWIFFYILIGGFFLSESGSKVRKNLVNSSQLEDIYPLASTHQPLFGATYQVASLISWKTQSLVPKLNGLSRHDFYDSLPESEPTATKFYVLKLDYSTWPDKYDKYQKIKLQSFDKTGLELYQFSYE